MNIKIVKIGIDKNDPLVLAALEFGKRMGTKHKYEVRSIKEEKRGKSANDVQIREKEGRALIAASDGFFRIALDLGGKELTSESFARLLEQKELEGKKLAFLIGGATGLSEEVLHSADYKLKLSSMTLTHRMAYLFIAEQVYRATQILVGGPYHK